TDVLRRIAAAAGRIRRLIAPVILDEASAAPEIGLPVDAGSGIRTVLPLRRDVARSMPRAHVVRQVGADQAGAQTLDANPWTQLDIGIFQPVIAASRLTGVRAGAI